MWEWSIFIYDNNFSDDDYRQVLLPYIDGGLVTLIDWPVKQGQVKAYKNCVERFRNESNWIGFLDIDEYVVPNKDDSINDFLFRFENRPSVMIYWRMFGTSGKMKRKDGLVTEDLTICWPKYTDIGKCFYNTRYEIATDVKHLSAIVHKCFCKLGCIIIPPVNSYGKFCVYTNPLPKIDNPQRFNIQVNHYFTKTYNEYLRKMKRGDAYFEKNPRDLDYFYKHEMKNQDADFHAYKYLIKLKLAMHRGGGDIIKNYAVPLHVLEAA